MGTGVPFQNDSSELLINMPSKKMSLNLDDETEFWKWYKQQTDFNFDETCIFTEICIRTLYEILFIYVHENISKYIN